MKRTPVVSVVSVDELDPEVLLPLPLLLLLPLPLPLPPPDEDPSSPVESSLPVVSGLSVVLEGSMPVVVTVVEGEVSVRVAVSEVLGPDVGAPVDASPSVPLLETTLSQPLRAEEGEKKQSRTHGGILARAVPLAMIFVRLVFVDVTP